MSFHTWGQQLREAFIFVIVVNMASLKAEKPVGSQPAGPAKKEPSKAPTSGQAPKKTQEPKKKVHAHTYIFHFSFFIFFSPFIWWRYQAINRNLTRDLYVLRRLSWISLSVLVVEYNVLNSSSGSRKG